MDATSIALLVQAVAAQEENNGLYVGIPGYEFRRSVSRLDI